MNVIANQTPAMSAVFLLGLTWPPHVASHDAPYPDASVPIRAPRSRATLPQAVARPMRGSKEKPYVDDLKRALAFYRDGLVTQRGDSRLGCRDGTPVRGHRGRGRAARRVGGRLDGRAVPGPKRRAVPRRRPR